MFFVILNESIQFRSQALVRSQQPDIEMTPVLHEFDNLSILILRHVRIALEQGGNPFTRYRPGTGRDTAGVPVHCHSPLNPMLGLSWNHVRKLRVRKSHSERVSSLLSASRLFRDAWRWP